VNVRTQPAFAGTQNKDQLVLVNRNMLSAPRMGTMLLVLVVSVLGFAALVAFIILDANRQAGAGWLDTAAKLWVKVGWDDVAAAARHSWALLLQSVILLGTVLLMDRARRLERLVLSPDGIRYVSPFPDVLKRFVPDWSLSWNQVQAVELGFAVGHPRRRTSPNVMLMSFVGPRERRRIAPILWVDPDNYAAPKILRQAFRIRLRPEPPADMKKLAAECEVLRYLAAKQPQIRTIWNAAPVATMTSLEKNPHARIVLAMLALLFVYTLIDLVMGPESYIDDPHQFTGLYVGAGIAAGVLGGLWLSRSALKRVEQYGLAILLGAVAGFAMIPGALRINEFIGGNPLVSYDCRIIRDNDAIILQPLAPGIPPIKYFANNPYWAKFGKGAVYPVRIRKGILGFYQFDSDVITERMRLERDKW
jgi:hypothetical protein